MQKEGGTPLNIGASLCVYLAYLLARKAEKVAKKPTKAERATITGKGVFFEIGFQASGTSREATFKDDGTFVEEE